MDLSVRCPQCQKKHIYFSHEVGMEAQCRGCGQTLQLRPQKAVETIRIAIAVVIVFAIAAGITFRFARIGRAFQSPPTMKRHAPEFIPNESPLPAD